MDDPLFKHFFPCFGITLDHDGSSVTALLQCTTKIRQIVFPTEAEKREREELREERAGRRKATRDLIEEAGLASSSSEDEDDAVYHLCHGAFWGWSTIHHQSRATPPP